MQSPARGACINGTSKYKGQAALSTLAHVGGVEVVDAGHAGLQARCNRSCAAPAKNNKKVQKAGSVDSHGGTCRCVVFVDTGHVGRRAPQSAAYGGSNTECQSDSTQETSSAGENLCCCDGALHRHAGFKLLLPRHTSRLCAATKRDAHACKRRRMYTKAWF